MKQHKWLVLPPSVWTACLVAVALLLWQMGVRTGQINPFFFSSPVLLWEKFLAMITSGKLIRHLNVTVQEAALGLLFGSVLGTLSGLALGNHPKVSRGLMPLLTGINGLPKLALGPLIIVWFGIGLPSKVVLSAIIVYFIFVFNLYAGVKNTDETLIAAVRLLGGTRWQVLKKVIWPSCTPWVLASLRTSVGLAFTGAIVGEYLGASRGLGWLIANASGRYDIDEVLCCIFVIMFLMVLIDGVVRLLEHRLLRWQAVP